MGGRIFVFAADVLDFLVGSTRVVTRFGNFEEIV
jgi:hypothetical protein